MSKYWSDQESNVLKEAIQQATTRNGISWDLVAEQVGTKTPHQCSIRYHNIDKFSGPVQREKVKWSQILDLTLLGLADGHCKDWQDVARDMDLSVSLVKNRYYVLQRRQRQEKEGLVQALVRQFV